MHLKTLSIKGFKSFADNATLELEPGVTVVVGPNGSGKSNVVDAIAWVLGAQAPKSVRSQKMDDVIFAGAGNDVVDGLGGDDLICGEDGEDVLNGDAGADRLEGGDGHDVLDGGSGADELLGGEGDDVLLGGDGDDTAEGGSGDDAYRMGDGDDVVNDDEAANDDRDSVDGEAGNNTCDVDLFDVEVAC